MDRKEGDPSLADLVRKGILMLDGEQGFFMMVEGGRIDWQSHANDAAAVVSEVLDFDRAVVEALRFQAAHPLDTLVIVTSDHETGGLRLDETCDIALLARQKGSCDAFAARVAALTVAPASSYEDALATVGDFFGLGRDGLALAPEEDAELRAAFQAVKSGEKPSDPAGAARFQQLYGGCNPLSITASRILARRAGLTWGAYSHTGTPVPIRAMGVGGELFGGEIDNTDVGLGIFLLIERGGEAAEVR
jgi:alkaline phosphatase